MQQRLLLEKFGTRHLSLKIWGIRYNGPFDGHNIEGLEKALRNASGFEGPTVIHVLTEKGRGYGPAENDPIKDCMTSALPNRELHRCFYRDTYQRG